MNSTADLTPEGGRPRRTSRLKVVAAALASLTVLIAVSLWASVTSRKIESQHAEPTSDSVPALIAVPDPALPRKVTPGFELPAGTATQAPDAPLADSPTTRPSTGELRRGVWVEVAGTGSCLNLRSAPRLTAPVASCQPDGFQGLITRGPEERDGQRWWHIAGQVPEGSPDGPTFTRVSGKGWAAETFLRFKAEGILEFEDIKVGDRTGDLTVELITGVEGAYRPRVEGYIAFRVLYSGETVVEGEYFNPSAALVFDVSEESGGKMPVRRFCLRNEAMALDALGVKEFGPRTRGRATIVIRDLVAVIRPIEGCHSADLVAVRPFARFEGPQEPVAVRSGESFDLTVVLRDHRANPLADKRVRWPAKQGSLSLAQAVTDSSGKATVTVQAPRVTVETLGIVEVSFSGDPDYSPTSRTITIKVVPPAEVPPEVPLQPAILFQRDIWRHNRESPIWRVNRDGSGLIRLPGEPIVPLHLSPTGERIAFVGTDGNIWVIDSTGHNLRRLTNLDLGPGSFPGGRITAWAPNGQRLLYSLRSKDYVIDVATADIRGPLKFLDRDRGREFVAWTQDSAGIIVSERIQRDRQRPDTVEYRWSVVDLATEIVSPLSREPFRCSNHQRSISPDWTKVLYACHTGTSRIVLANLDNTGQRVLLEGPYTEFQLPRFSPDGNGFVFEKYGDLFFFDLGARQGKLIAAERVHVDGWLDPHTLLIWDWEGSAAFTIGIPDGSKTLVVDLARGE